MAASASSPAPRRRLRIRRDQRRGVIGGVCAGLADSLGIDPIIVRIAFVAGLLAGGAGAVVYGLAWVFLPAADGGSVAGRLRGQPGSVEIAAGVGLLALSALLLLRALGWWFSDAIVWPAVVAAVGGAVIWRHAVGAPVDARVPKAADRAGGPADGVAARGAAVPEAAPPLLGGRALSTILLGAALVMGGALVFLWANGALSAAGDTVLSVVVVVLALGLILAPIWWRLGRSLAAERSARIRSQARAELAADLHDSVLQTLALVQRRADDPREVATLARRQERELRAWLLGRPAERANKSLAGALEAVAADVEDSHGGTVEVVNVGDCPLDERAEAVLAAAREAIVNAAKFAGEAGPIDVFAEVTPERVEVFVRDRGAGFDVDAVPEERRGVRESIVGRMERAGGAAVVRSGDGAGTEVELSIGRGRA
jgi:signal transduction histidine kinase/phage shock protein PspC (stress-responsive transcriptional regulator)